MVPVHIDKHHLPGMPRSALAHGAAHRYLSSN